MIHTASVPYTSSLQVVAPMAMILGSAVAAGALLCAAVAGVISVFPHLVSRHQPVAAPDTGEIIEQLPDRADVVRGNARRWLKAALVWACGGALVAAIGTVVHDPQQIFPALGLLVAAGLLTVFIAAGFRLSGHRAHNGIQLRHLMLAGGITTVVASAVLVLLTMIVSSPAAGVAP